MLLVRDALLHELDEHARIPPDGMRALLDALPPPPQKFGATAAVLRALGRLEVAGRLGNSALREAQQLRAECVARDQLHTEWIARLELLYGRLMHAADGAEGRAIVRLHRALRFASAGWDFAADSELALKPPPASSGGKRKAVDAVGAEIRLAVSSGCACHALSELLARARPIRTPTIQSVLIDADHRVLLGRRELTLKLEQLDRWRSDCGMTRTAVGWESPSTRPRSRAPRLRDAPFGVKPL